MHQDCSKTAFFDEWHFPSSGCFLCVKLINKAAPRRVRQGTHEVRACVDVCITFGVWIVRCDLGTLIFTQQGSITRVVVLFIVFLLWQSTHFSFCAKRWAFFFSFFLFLFVKHWILKESKARSGIPCSEVCYPQKNEGEWEFKMTLVVLY